MSEINNFTGNSGKKTGVRRCKKLSTKIDLTPMVDLGFLLITFFVFTSAINKPKVIKMNLPAGDVPNSTYGNSTVLTVIPIDKNKVFYYNGELKDILHNGGYGITLIGGNGGLGDIIRLKQAALDKSLHFKRNDLMLIIKPSPLSTYQNIVAVLDEVLINNLKNYAFVNLDPATQETMGKLRIK